jgi:hypothetical protein
MIRIYEKQDFIREKFGQQMDIIINGHITEEVSTSVLDVKCLYQLNVGTQQTLHIHITD